MSGKFNPSYVGLGELLASEGMQAHMLDRAEKIAEAARAQSPIGPGGDEHRTRYRDSWETDHGVREHPSRRAYAEVKNDVPYAAAVEFGNGRAGPKTITAHYVLTRAIDAARE